MSRKLFDPLRCPDDWVDWKERNIKTRDVSKIPRYVEPDGLEHWWDVRENIIRTNDKSIFLSFHSFYAREYTGHSYAILHFDGAFGTITQERENPDQVSFSPNYRERTKAGELVWHIDHIFKELTVPDNESYPWVNLAWGALPIITIKGLDHFKDRKQQDRFIYLINTLLSRHDGVAGKALEGEEAKGKVVFGDKLFHSFETGELIR